MAILFELALFENPLLERQIVNNALRARKHGAELVNYGPLAIAY